jgi:anti-anti-sigma factor
MENAHPTVITLTGEWDIYRRDELRGIFAAAYRERQVVFDLSAVTYADSTVLSELVQIRKHRVDHNLPIFALVPSPTFRRILTITHLHQFLPCFTTVEDAIASFDSPQIVTG